MQLVLHQENYDENITLNWIEDWTSSTQVTVVKCAHLLMVPLSKQVLPVLFIFKCVVAKKIEDIVQSL